MAVGKKATPRGPNLVWAERIKPMSLNQGSVPILACDLGMFESAGVGLTVREYLGAPAAVAALRAGEAAFAQVPTLEALRLLAERRWPGKIFWVNKAEKTSSSRGFVMMSATSIRRMGDLRGKRFGVGADGDYWAPIIANMLRLNGLRREEIVWVKDLDPVQKADMLLEGKIDVMLTSIQNYIGKLEGRRSVHVLAEGDELSRYRDSGLQGPSFVGIASDKTLERDRDEVKTVVVVLMKAARMFGERPAAWVDAASRRRPDVHRTKIRRLWNFFKGDWPVNGGIGEAGLEEMLEGLKPGKGPGSTRSVPVKELLAGEFERSALMELGVYET